jgi:hypothetical protein
MDINIFFLLKTIRFIRKFVQFVIICLIEKISTFGKSRR